MHRPGAVFLWINTICYFYNDELHTKVISIAKSLSCIFAHSIIKPMERRFCSAAGPQFTIINYSQIITSVINSTTKQIDGITLTLALYKPDVTD